MDCGTPPDHRNVNFVNNDLDAVPAESKKAILAVSWIMINM